LDLNEDEKLHLYSLNAMFPRDYGFMHFICGVVEMYANAETKGRLTVLRLIAKMIELADEVNNS